MRPEAVAEALRDTAIPWIGNGIMWTRVAPTAVPKAV